MAIPWSVLTAAVLVAFRGCELGWGQPVVTRRALPEPQVQGGAALSTVLATRRSVRVFGTRELEDRELGQLLWAAQGSNDSHRTAPSAGGLYPLTVRVVDAHGVWRYVPADHALVREAIGDRREGLAIAVLRQSSIRGAPLSLVITAELAITTRKYGPKSGERFATLEAGHVAQNVLLTATALGLGAVPVGAFEDEPLRKVLALPPEVTPLYVIPIGAMPD